MVVPTTVEITEKESTDCTVLTGLPQTGDLCDVCPTPEGGDRSFLYPGTHAGGVLFPGSRTLTPPVPLFL